MVQGRVARSKQPLVPVTVLDSEGIEHTLTVVMDTGSNGELTLPREVIQRLGLAYDGLRTIILADGNEVETSAYFAEIVWVGQRTIVTVFQSEDQYFLGMSLLWGQRLTMDAVEGGRITIDEISSA